MNIINYIRRRLNPKKYDNIILLGYNCELAFQFFKYFKGLESGLFNWTYSFSINDLIFVIKNFYLLLEGDISGPDPLWECANTKIRFHGRATQEALTDPNAKEDDLQELKSRVKYLKEKFLNTLKVESTKLFIYKVSSEDCSKVNIANKMRALTNEILNLSSGECEILFVVEKEFFTADLKEKLFDNKIHIRYVNKFAPDNLVVVRKYSDSKWKEIFAEFRPQKVYKKEQKFKDIS